jgi:hypothetical protein
VVDLLVPFPPHLGRGEHTTGTALVTEGSLTSAVSTTTRDTGDTGNSATFFSISYPCLPIVAKLSRTGTPGLGGGLFTSLLAHSIGLSLVLCDTGVHLPMNPSAPVNRLEISRLTARYPDGSARRTQQAEGGWRRWACPPPWRW